MIIGYARVSTADQSLEVQKTQLTAAGVDRIYTDNATGANMNRDGFSDALAQCQPGDTILATKTDRIGRSNLHFAQLVKWAADNDITIQSLDGLDTSTETGRLMGSILASVAEYELARMKRRQREGLNKAKQNGQHLGRRRKMTRQQLESARLLLETQTMTQVAHQFGVSKRTLQRMMKGNADKDANQASHS